MLIKTKHLLIRVIRSKKICAIRDKQNICSEKQV
jgi:hypothetical protein